MKTMIKPAIYGSMAAIGLMLLVCIGGNVPAFTWRQIALIAGVVQITVSMHWFIKSVCGIWEDE